MSQTSDNTDLSSKIVTSFSYDVIKEVLKSHFSNPKTKITDEALELMTELANTLVIESAVRAAKQSHSENTTTVTLDHIESVLPQIMLDFP